MRRDAKVPSKGGAGKDGARHCEEREKFFMKIKKVSDHGMKKATHL